jgi:hypothetical protein
VNRIDVDPAAAVNRALLKTPRGAEDKRNRILAYLYDRAVRQDVHRYVSIPRMCRELDLEDDADIVRIILDDLEFRGLAVGRNQPSKGKTLYQITARGIDVIQRDPSIVESRNWTGLEATEAWNDEKLRSVLAEINRVDRIIDTLSLSNEQASQVRAYIAAAKIIAESPRPDVDIISALLTKASELAGIAALFVSLIALMRAG